MNSSENHSDQTTNPEVSPPIAQQIQQNPIASTLAGVGVNVNIPQEQILPIPTVLGQTPTLIPYYPSDMQQQQTGLIYPQGPFQFVVPAVAAAGNSIAQIPAVNMSSSTGQNGISMVYVAAPGVVPPSAPLQSTNGSEPMNAYQIDQAHFQYLQAATSTAGHASTPIFAPFPLQPANLIAFNPQDLTGEATAVLSTASGQLPNLELQQGLSQSQQQPQILPAMLYNSSFAQIGFNYPPNPQFSYLPFPSQMPPNQQPFQPNYQHQFIPQMPSPHQSHNYHYNRNNNYNNRNKNKIYSQNNQKHYNNNNNNYVASHENNNNYMNQLPTNTTQQHKWQTFLQQAVELGYNAAKYASKAKRNDRQILVSEDIFDMTLFLACKSGKEQFIADQEATLEQFIQGIETSMVVSDLDQFERKITHKICERYGLRRPNVEIIDTKGNITIERTDLTRIPEKKVMTLFLEQEQNGMNTATREAQQQQFSVDPQQSVVSTQIHSGKIQYQQQHQNQINYEYNYSYNQNSNYQNNNIHKNNWQQMPIYQNDNQSNNQNNFQQGKGYHQQQQIQPQHLQHSISNPQYSNQLEQPQIFNENEINQEQEENPKSHEATDEITEVTTKATLPEVSASFEESNSQFTHQNQSNIQYPNNTHFNAFPKNQKGNNKLHRNNNNNNFQSNQNNDNIIRNSMNYMDSNGQNQNNICQGQFDQYPPRNKQRNQYQQQNNYHQRKVNNQYSMQQQQSMQDQQQSNMQQWGTEQQKQGQEQPIIDFLDPQFMDKYETLPQTSQYQQQFQHQNLTLNQKNNRKNPQNFKNMQQHQQHHRSQRQEYNHQYLENGSQTNNGQRLQRQQNNNNNYTNGDYHSNSYNNGYQNQQGKQVNNTLRQQNSNRVNSGLNTQQQHIQQPPLPVQDQNNQITQTIDQTSNHQSQIFQQQKSSWYCDSNTHINSTQIQQSEEESTEDLEKQLSQVGLTITQNSHLIQEVPVEGNYIKQQSVLASNDQYQREIETLSNQPQLIQDSINPIRLTSQTTHIINPNNSNRHRQNKNDQYSHQHQQQKFHHNSSKQQHHNQSNNFPTQFNNNHMNRKQYPNQNLVSAPAQNYSLHNGNGTRSNYRQSNPKGIINGNRTTSYQNNSRIQEQTSLFYQSEVSNSLPTVNSLHYHEEEVKTE